MAAPQVPLLDGSGKKAKDVSLEEAVFAAELKPLGMGDELVDHGRRDIVAERPAHLGALQLDAAIDVKRRRGGEDEERQRGV